MEGQRSKKFRWVLRGKKNFLQTSYRDNLDGCTQDLIHTELMWINTFVDLESCLEIELNIYFNILSAGNSKLKDSVVWKLEENGSHLASSMYSVGFQQKERNPSAGMNCSQI